MSRLISTAVNGLAILDISKVLASDQASLHSLVFLSGHISCKD